MVRLYNGGKLFGFIQRACFYFFSRLLLLVNKMSRTYKEILDELVQWEFHELLEQHSLQELEDLREKFEEHRKELIKALKEKEKKGEID